MQAVRWHIKGYGFSLGSRVAHISIYIYTCGYIGIWDSGCYPNSGEAEGKEN